jgi:tetratricopeptide (TPR) repeat protein
MFEAALRIKPNSPTVLNALGSVLYSRDKEEEAKEKWKQAIEADPKFSAAHFNMAVAYETERRYPEAIEQYSIVIHLSPKMGEAFYRLATIYLKDKHLAQARVMYANSLVLGQDAEYFRDAKKQLAAIDEQLAN